jgi:hypothetical protein
VRANTGLRSLRLVSIEEEFEMLLPEWEHDRAAAHEAVRIVAER